MLKIYKAGPPGWEWAILVFANNAQEARRVAWTYGKFFEKPDVRVKQLKKSPWLYQEMKKNIPHHIDSARHCSVCGNWGDERLYTETDELCYNCYHGVFEE